MAQLTIPTLTERADYYNLEEAARQGLLLPDASALALEEILGVNDQDIVTRARLLGYYAKTRKSKRDSERLALNRAKHILWFIKNAPDCKFASDKYFAIDRAKNANLYTEVKSAWEHIISRNSAPTQALVNAAIFLFGEEPDEGERIARSVLTREPQNRWARRLLMMPAGYEPAEKTFDSVAMTAQADEEYLDRLVSLGQSLPPISVETLEEVLNEFPDDLSARAELVGHYHERYQRENLFNCDPEMLEKLVRHLLWFIEHIPGSSFVATAWVNIDKKVAPQEHKLLEEVWLAKIESEANNARVIASAAMFFWRNGNNARANSLAKKARKLATGNEVEEILRFGFYERGKAPYDIDFAKNGRLLDSVSKIQRLEKIERCFGEYTISEWASEVDLSGAHLTGVYWWTPPQSISNLERTLSPDSADLYNRARIIGAYDRYYSYGGYKSEAELSFEMTDARRESHIRHMKWFINKIPECRFIATFYMEPFKKHAPEIYSVIKESILAQVEENPGNKDILINAAAALCRADSKESRKLAKILQKEDPDWGRHLLMMLGEQPAEPDVKRILDQNGFQAGKRNGRLSKVAKELRVSNRAIFGRDLPWRTIWSNERCLESNPNDVVLRAELFDAYSSADQFHVSLQGFTPHVLPHLIEHNLWFIQHLPDVYMSCLGCDFFNHRGRELGPHAIVLEAAKQQLRAYPKNVAVTLSLIHYFPVGFEKEALVFLRRAAKHHPKNRQLIGQISHRKQLSKGFR